MGLKEDIEYYQQENLKRTGRKNQSDSYHPEKIVVTKTTETQKAPEASSDLAKTATSFFNAMSRRKAQSDSSSK